MKIYKQQNLNNMRYMKDSKIIIFRIKTEINKRKKLDTPF